MEHDYKDVGVRVAPGAATGLPRRRSKNVSARYCTNHLLISLDRRKRLIARNHPRRPFQSTLVPGLSTRPT